VATKTIPYFTQAGLLRAATDAARENRNRKVDVRALAKHLSAQLPDTKYPVVFHFVHNEVEARCNIAIGGDMTIWLDVPLSDFTRLPVAEVDVE